MLTVSAQTDWNDGRLLTALMTSLGANVVTDDVSLNNSNNHVRAIQRGDTVAAKNTAAEFELS